MSIVEDPLESKFNVAAFLSVYRDLKMENILLDKKKKSIKIVGMC